MYKVKIIKQYTVLHTCFAILSSTSFIRRTTLRIYWIDAIDSWAFKDGLAHQVCLDKEMSAS